MPLPRDYLNRYMNRTLPMAVPHALSADDLYALTPYILPLDPTDFVADRNNLPRVDMRNHENFIWTDPRPGASAKPCMDACGNAAE